MAGCGSPTDSLPAFRPRQRSTAAENVPSQLAIPSDSRWGRSAAASGLHQRLWYSSDFPWRGAEPNGESNVEPNGESNAGGGRSMNVIDRCVGR
ncbi:MAG: hypothetical protein U0795_15735 [Pirellulales bacterium]